MPAANSPSTNSIRILKSDWGSLNPVLLAVLYPLKRNDSGDGWTQATGSRTISTADNFSVDDGYEVWDRRDLPQLYS